MLSSSGGTFDLNAALQSLLGNPGSTGQGMNVDVAGGMTPPQNDPYMGGSAVIPDQGPQRPPSAYLNENFPAPEQGPQRATLDQGPQLSMMPQGPQMPPDTFMGTGSTPGETPLPMARPAGAPPANVASVVAPDVASGQGGPQTAQIAQGQQPPQAPQGAPKPGPAGAAPPPPGTADPVQQVAGGGPKKHWLGNIFSDPREAAQFAGALGAGLKSVGNNWDKPGLAAFAGSAGSALEGGAKGDTAFYEKSLQALDRMQRARAQDDRAAYNAAQIEYHKLRLQKAAEVGTTRSRAVAYQLSPEGKLHTADQDIQKATDSYAKRRQDELKIAVQMNDAAAVQRIQGEIDAYAAQQRERIYKDRNLDPAAIRNLGKQDTPHQPKSTDEFNSTVKPGDWFINPKDGKKYKRTSEAPPAADAPDGILARTAAAMPAAERAERDEPYTSASVASYGGTPEGE